MYLNSTQIKVWNGNIVEPKLFIEMFTFVSIATSDYMNVKVISIATIDYINVKVNMFLEAVS